MQQAINYERFFYQLRYKTAIGKAKQQKLGMWADEKTKIRKFVPIEEVELKLMNKQVEAIVEDFYGSNFTFYVPSTMCFVKLAYEEISFSRQDPDLMKEVNIFVQKFVLQQNAKICLKSKGNQGAFFFGSIEFATIDLRKELIQEGLNLF